MTADSTTTTTTINTTTHTNTNTTTTVTDDRLSLEFFRHTPICTIILDASLVIRQVSDSFLDIAGLGSPTDALGLHFDDFVDRVAALPTLVSARKPLRNAQETLRPSELKHLDVPDGSAWNIRIVPILRHASLRYLQMELTDVTTEHQRQLDLEERLYTNETFRILVETVKDYAIFMLDPNGNIATWNAGAQRFKGYKKEEIIGKHFSNFYSQEDRDIDKPGRELADALRDGRVEDEGWRYRKDGSKFWANVIITPVYRGQTLLGFSKVTRDLTERRSAEVKLIEAYEEASKLKSEFLANMSHEIRTPMHGMLSALTLLLDTPLNPEQRELAHVIEESGEILLHVINDILDYSKLASGCFSISTDIINVSEILQTIHRAQEKCRKPGIDLQTYIDPKLPKAAEGDSLRYRQIVQNLMSNAMKFTEEGYVHVHAKLHEEDDEYYTILTEVVDTGIGIPSEVSGSLFTPFMQFDNSATKRYKGTGLGLSICKSLSELMGGHIGFYDNPEGHGSVFWFTAKMKKVQHVKDIDDLHEELEQLTLRTSTSPFEDVKHAAVGKKILLAEDNPINQKVMLKMLTSLGFRDIDVALDGRDAVALSIRNPPPYHVILMDINMPLLDGVGATKEIRNAGVQTPIIAMTANALKGQAELYLAKGMNGYVPKPVDRNLLVKILLSWLNSNAPSPTQLRATPSPPPVPLPSEAAPSNSPLPLAPLPSEAAPPNPPLPPAPSEPAPSQPTPSGPVPSEPSPSELAHSEPAG
ncbi:uncharacterized protein EI97DRAFT_379683 [Westerdykella ornata]|uniref:Two-component system protein A n=1 Tax=Westerdykella ornata TaxID=318751 RepID=A0A6A6JF06_WESOR|nr:uncharacterized protein EI97DRAFT_379683 [Westerdykella ornata]KAF2275200.1 hypothetical protein EI97DRAFT_379683 [Westerdykella ornata]